MTPGPRKFVGTIAMLVVTIVYAALASTIYTSWLVGAHPLVLLVYFIIAGLCWVFPAGMVIKWMSRPLPGQ